MAPLVPIHTGGQRYAMPVLILTVFVGAFLLFSMEPFVGRLLAPVFGGSIHIWLICLTFFQLMLLVGYAYTYLASKIIGRWHLVLLAIPVISLPFPAPIPPAAGESVIELLFLLARQFALPFALLSTTAIVAQLWLSRSTQNVNPYPLYGASNAGSLAALLAYPLLIEPFWGLKWQSMAWTGGYILYTTLAVLAYTLVRPRMSGVASDPKIEREAEPVGEPLSLKSLAFWTLLSGLTSALLFTVTQVIAVEMGSFPLVWIVPLALYLLSFMVTFREGGGIPSMLRRIWPETILLGFILYMVPSTRYILHLGHLVVFTAVCLLIHGMLYEDRPHPRHLSVFYIAIAFGGFAGGMAVSVFAPLVFPKLWEYPILLAGLFAVFCLRFGKGLLASWRQSSFLWKRVRLAPAAVLAGIALLIGYYSSGEAPRAVHRNYYGISRIVDTPLAAYEGAARVRMLIHGSTIHGMEFLDERHRGLPTIYYHPTGGLGDVFAALPSPVKIAAVGLGAGTVAAYTHPGDLLDFYEIDPDLETLARRHFSYLDASRAQTRILVGDGRISLRRAAPQERRYELIFVDAFSGEGIPTHLMTKEALAVYLERLTDHGMLLFHVTNRYYDLRPVVKATAAGLGLHGVMKGTTTAQDASVKPVRTQYIALARNEIDLAALRKQGWIKMGNDDGLKACRPWTDDYINILAPLSAKMQQDGFLR